MRLNDILSEEILNEMTLDTLAMILSNPEKMKKYADAISSRNYLAVGQDKFVTDSTNKKLSRQYVENTLTQRGIMSKVYDRQKLKIILDYYLPVLA